MDNPSVASKKSSGIWPEHFCGLSRMVPSLAHASRSLTQRTSKPFHLWRPRWQLGLAAGDPAGYCVDDWLVDEDPLVPKYAPIPPAIPPPITIQSKRLLLLFLAPPPPAS